jgi:KaiC/GvpD/RAD55 family RecA-like ATPase
MMALGDVAAKLGLPVFPCLENKRPVTETGFKAATVDPERIVEMFSRKGSEMIGVPTGQASGLLVVDIDVRDDRSGMVWLNDNSGALPPTRTHKTKSGGLHLVFRYPPGADIRNSAGRIAPGVDVRGEGGYVIFPPSPGYRIADPAEPADMPLWLIRACCKPEPEVRPVQAPQLVTRFEGGSRYGLAGLEAECRAIATAAEGSKHDTLNRAAYSIGGLVSAGELEEGVARSALRDALGAIRDRCRDYKAAQTTLEGAFAAGIARPRAKPEPRPTASAEPPPHMHYDQAYYDSLENDPFAGMEPNPEPEPERQAKPPPSPAPHGLPLTYYLDIQPRLETLDFVEGLLGENSSVVLYGESNSGKTFFATDLALHVASGHPWRGRAVERGGVVYAALEGSAGFSNRITAWRDAHDDRDIPFVAIPAALNLLAPDADTPRLIAAVKEAAAVFGIPVKLIVVDTLSRAMAGGNENASEDMGALVANMDRIRAETKATVLFVHHAGKDASKGARGHSILRASIDTEIEVSATEGSKVRVARVVKQREMETEGSFEFELKQVELGLNHRGKPVTTCVVLHQDEPSVPHARHPTGHAQTAYRLLADAIASHGEKHHASLDIPSIPEVWWRDRFYERAMAGAEQDTKQKAFRRAADTLQQTSRIGINRGRVWIAK